MGTRPGGTSMANVNLTPWHTDKWFVSPWNYLDEVMQGTQFPKRVKFHDVCLRDGEQQDGKRSVDCGVKGIVMEVPSSEHIIQYAYKWTLDQAVETSIEATQYAKSQGLYVVFFPIDASRAEMSWYLKIIEQVATQGHMDALALVDTFGVLSPHAVRYFVRHTRERIKKPLETHFHMDFGMGVANTVIAVAEGAEVIHSTISGIGERAGNAPTEDTLLALLTMYGVDTSAP